MLQSDVLALLATASRTLALTSDDAGCIAEFCRAARAFGVTSCAVYLAPGAFRPPGMHALEDANPQVIPLFARVQCGGEAVLDGAAENFVVALGPASRDAVAFLAGSGGRLDESAWSALRVLAAGLERIDRTARLPLGRDAVAALAHDVRGPLTSIIGFAELIREGVLDAAEVVDAAGTIVSAARRLNAIATDTLTASLLERNQIAVRCDPVDVAHIVREAIDECEGAARVTFAPGTGTSAFVEGDRGRLRQAFGHLIANALKFSPDGTPVVVGVRAGEGGVTAFVQDEGVGISPSESATIFERAVRGANARASSAPGRGLGLFVARGLIRLHGGDVTADSMGEGHGATFNVSLPALPRGSQ